MTSKEKNNYLSFLKVLIGKPLSFAFKLENYELSVFQFGDIVRRACSNSKVAGQEYELSLHIKCPFKVIRRDKPRIINKYDSDTPCKVFDSHIHPLIGLTVKRIKLTDNHDLWLDLGSCFVIFNVYDDSYESWRFLSNNVPYSVQLIADGKKLTLSKSVNQSNAILEEKYYQIDYLKQLINKPLSFAFKFSDCELFAFRFGDITNIVNNDSSSPGVFFEFSIHSISVVQIISKYNADHLFEYDGDSPYNSFNEKVQSLFNLTVQHIQISRCHFLTLDLGDWWLQFETYANEDESWRFFTFESPLTPHLVANDKSLSFHFFNESTNN